MPNVYEITANQELMICEGCGVNRWWMDSFPDDHAVTVRCSHCGREEHLSAIGGWSATPKEA